MTSSGGISKDNDRNGQESHSEKQFCEQMQLDHTKIIELFSRKKNVCIIPGIKREESKKIKTTKKVQSSTVLKPEYPVFEERN